MKTLFSALMICLSTNAFATPQPVRETVDIKNSKFAEAITKAIEKNVKPQSVTRVGGNGLIYIVAKGFECEKSTATAAGRRTNETSYSCRILGDAGWNYLGSETYGSGSNQSFSLALYAALDVQEKSEEGIARKTIEMNVPDPRGGTERNLLSCIKPSDKLSRMGMRASCQLINAL